jgi:5'-3' exonuclease
LAERTNCSVIQCPTAEGDDIIARWIALHPQDEHIIISSDTDFVQLIAPNVTQYNGISDEHITLEGYFDAKGKAVIDKKKQEPKTIPDPKWLLFEKCMRGDTSDNVFSAFPGVRTKGTKNKVGLQEAFEDKDRQGYNWNNMMLQRWTDHNGQEHRVLDDYNRNVALIDLTAQPNEIKDAVDTCIHEQMSHKDVGQVGVRFMQFCGKYDLIKCSESADSFGRWMNETYKGVLNDNHS